MQEKNDKLNSRPRTLKELARAYGNVSPATFRGWLKGNKEIDFCRPKNGGYYFSIAEIDRITKVLGEP